MTRLTPGRMPLAALLQEPRGGLGVGGGGVPTQVRAPTPLNDADAAHCVLPTDAPSGLATWTSKVPDKVIEGVLSPGSCLVVGDAPGDPDCFCSAAALARARNHMGLPAAAHVDAVPPKQIQGVLKPGEILDRKAVRADLPETVILVDNDGTRVGPAAAEAMRNAKRVIVIDHHEVDPTQELLGMNENAELIVWKDTDADAAALMVLATTMRATGVAKKELPEEAWADIVKPLVCAMYSDTRGFEASRTSPETVRLITQLIGTGAIGLRATLSGFGGGIPRIIRDKLYGSVDEDSSQHGNEKLGTFKLKSTALLDAWVSARVHTPELTWSDVLFLALDHVEARVRQEGYDVTVFTAGAKDGAEPFELSPELQKQLPNGGMKFSIRTKEGALAPALAKHLGGGGKPHEGGGVTDASAEAVLTQAREWMNVRADLAKFAGDRNLGGA